ncbi:MAG: hypothetical protein HF978_20445 [Desulfobacteraceae bacterium]|nr:hypothetical protein [Desulfobacteraceae bacterium]MBC2757919.1 hypothetical protein [Desulfobacteraceae bacterium]
MPAKRSNKLDNKYKSIVLAYVNFCFDSTIAAQLLDEVDECDVDFNNLNSELLSLKIFLFDCLTCSFVGKNLKLQNKILNFFYNVLENRIKNIEDDLISDFNYLLDLRKKSYAGKIINWDISDIGEKIAKKFVGILKVGNDEYILNLIHEKINSICDKIASAYERVDAKNNH